MLLCITKQFIFQREKKKAGKESRDWNKVFSLNFCLDIFYLFFFLGDEAYKTLSKRERKKQNKIGTISRLGADCIGLRWFVYSCGDNYFQSRAGRASSLRYRLPYQQSSALLQLRFLLNSLSHTHRHNVLMFDLQALFIIYSLLFFFFFYLDEEIVEKKKKKKSGTLCTTLMSRLGSTDTPTRAPGVE